MATILELFNSGEIEVSADSPSANLRYVVLGTEDTDEVRALVDGTLPASFLGLFFNSYKALYHGGGVWEVTAKYSNKKPEGADDQKGGDQNPENSQAKSESFSFDTTGGSVKITQSLSHTHFYFDGIKTVEGTPGNENIDFQGAIGVDDDGNVAGVEVQVPKFSFTLKRVIPDPINPDYVNALYRKTGKVNTDPILLNVNGLLLQFNPGELKYDGAQGEKRNEEDWEITLKFSFSENSPLQVGQIDMYTVFDSQGRVAEKKGWHYAWVAYEDDVNQSPKKLIRKPIQLNIEQVFEETTLAELFA
ncbi:MAG: hypothetical protein KatS3mg105_3305 [Gemmatales bacterium]|nr:MAG: hypothetical protein KatS3mg105_3305 [Gemmatales bacterium]